MNYEYYLGELNGYLKALGRACGWRYIFGVTSDTNCQSLDEFIEKQIEREQKYREESFGGYSKIEYDDLLTQMESMIFSGRFQKKEGHGNAQDNFLKALMEDIHDYVGLMSTAINPRASFYPFINGPVFKVDITSPNFGKSFFFAMEIEGIYLLAYFYEKTKPSA